MALYRLSAPVSLVLPTNASAGTRLPTWTVGNPQRWRKSAADFCLWCAFSTRARHALDTRPGRGAVAAALRPRALALAGLGADEGTRITRVWEHRSGPAHHASEFVGDNLPGVGIPVLCSVDDGAVGSNVHDGRQALQSERLDDGALGIGEAEKFFGVGTEELL